MHEAENEILRAKVKRLAQRLDAQEEELGEAEATWRCLHCGYKTADEAEAHAHWGEHGDLQEPVCVEWSKLNADGRLEAYQELLTQLYTLEHDLEAVTEERDAAMKMQKDLEQAVCALGYFVHVLVKMHEPVPVDLLLDMPAAKVCRNAAERLLELFEK